MKFRSHQSSTSLIRFRWGARFALVAVLAGALGLAASLRHIIPSRCSTSTRRSPSRAQSRTSNGPMPHVWIDVIGRYAGRPEAVRRRGLRHSGAEGGRVDVQYAQTRRQGHNRAEPLAQRRPGRIAGECQAPGWPDIGDQSEDSMRATIAPGSYFGIARPVACSARRRWLHWRRSATPWSFSVWPWPERTIVARATFLGSGCSTLRFSVRPDAQVRGAAEGGAPAGVRSSLQSVPGGGRRRARRKASRWPMLRPVPTLRTAREHERLCAAGVRRHEEDHLRVSGRLGSAAAHLHGPALDLPWEDVEPSYEGYSVGRWEGNTLVVDTGAVKIRTTIDGVPHSEAMQIHERIRLLDDDTLEDVFTITDPKAFKAPWVITKHYKDYETQAIGEANKPGQDLDASQQARVRAGVRRRSSASRTTAICGVQAAPSAMGYAP